MWTLIPITIILYKFSVTILRNRSKEAIDSGTAKACTLHTDCELHKNNRAEHTSINMLTHGVHSQLIVISAFHTSNPIHNVFFCWLSLGEDGEKEEKSEVVHINKISADELKCIAIYNVLQSLYI